MKVIMECINKLSHKLPDDIIIYILQYFYTDITSIKYEHLKQVVPPAITHNIYIALCGIIPNRSYINRSLDPITYKLTIRDVHINRGWMNFYESQFYNTYSEIIIVNCSIHDDVSYMLVSCIMKSIKKLTKLYIKPSTFAIATEINRYNTSNIKIII